MNVTLSTKELSTTLKVLASAYSRKNTLPILDNVLVEAIAPDSLRLTVHNFQFAAFSLRRVIKGVEVYEAGSTTVNLAELRNALPGTKTALTVTLEDGGNNTAFLRYPGTVLKLDSLPSEEFPPFPANIFFGGVFPITIFDSLSKLRTAIESTLPAVATDQARPRLTAIHGHKTYLEAADGFRLHRQEVGQNVPDFLLNAKLAKALLMSTAESGWIEAKGEHFHYADSDHWEASADMAWYGNKYPDLEQVIPRATQHKLEIDPKGINTWLDALSTAYKASEARIVKLGLNGKKDSVSLSTKNGKFATTAPAKIEADQPFEIGFNSGFLKDALTCANQESGKISLELNVATAPGLICNEHGYRAVVMPMFLYAD